MKGYMNRFVRINLSTNIIEDYEISDSDRENYLGGKILAGKILFDTIKEKIDPLSEENMLVITTSPLTLTTAACSSRFNVSTVSPQTGFLVSSNCGGNFGLALKRAGIDGLIIEGKAKNPIYIDIIDGEITICDASHLWGKLTGETQELMGSKKAGKFVIGPAGENLVKYAGVFSEERTAGRAGVGAVFGSKNLKGICADGTKKVTFFNQEKFKKANMKWIKNLKTHPLTGEQLPKYGTAGLVSGMQYRHLLATKNYQRGTFNDFDKISGETLAEDFLVKNKGCVTCPIQCGRVVQVHGKNVKGPEVETLTLLGSNLENNDMQSILDANHFCDEYGIDTISFGSSVGFAMELNEKGLWKNGLEFGNKTDLCELVRIVSLREGIGDDLAEGTKRLAKKYGGEEFAINTKGLEFAAYEPRGAHGMGLVYATGNRGGCHLNGGYTVFMEGLGLDVEGRTNKGKAATAVFMQNLMESLSAGGSCLFTSYAIFPGFLVKNPNKFLPKMVNKIWPRLGPLLTLVCKHPEILGVNVPGMIPHPYLINLATGMKLTIGTFLKIGERGYTIERLFNIRQGLTEKDDSLPKRMTDELEDPTNPKSKIELDSMKAQFYKIRSWDENGVPTPKRLKKLGIEL